MASRHRQSRTLAAFGMDEDGHSPYVLGANRDLRSLGDILVDYLVYAGEAGVKSFFELPGSPISREEFLELALGKAVAGPRLSGYLTAEIPESVATARVLWRRAETARCSRGGDPIIEISRERYERGRQRLVERAAASGEPNRLGNLLRALREYEGLSQGEFGERAGVGVWRICSMETGVLPSDGEVLTGIAGAAGIQPAALIDLWETEKREQAEKTRVRSSRDNFNRWAALAARGDVLTLGGRIKRHRIRANMTQWELGRRMGLDQYTISRFETDRTMPSLGELEDFMVAAKLSPEESGELRQAWENQMRRKCKGIRG